MNIDNNISTDVTKTFSHTMATEFTQKNFKKTRAFATLSAVCNFNL